MGFFIEQHRWQGLGIRFWMAAGRKDNHQIFPINLLCFGCSLLTVGINNLWRDRPDFLICCSKNKRQIKVLIDSSSRVEYEKRNERKDKKSRDWQFIEGRIWIWWRRLRQSRHSSLHLMPRLFGTHFFNKHLGLRSKLNVGLGQDELHMAFDVLIQSSIPKLSCP